MRLPYTSNPPTFSSPTDTAILNNILTRRSPGGLFPIDLTLLHSPPLADGFSNLAGAIRNRVSLEPKIREVIFCRVAALLRCEYEWNIHAPLAKEAGVDDQVLEELKRMEGWGDIIAGGEGGGGRREAKVDDRTRVVVGLVDEMTLGRGIVDDDLFECLGRFFGKREVVELTGCVAGFNAVARFCVALQVEERKS